jgi:hypothetical protein
MGQIDLSEIEHSHLEIFISMTNRLASKRLGCSLRAMEKRRHQSVVKTFGWNYSPSGPGRLRVR